MASLALALHAASARPRHGSCQTLITLTRRPLSVSRALHVLSSCVLCLALPAVALLEPGSCWSVCVYETDLLLLFAYIALLLLRASVELLPRGWRAVAFPRWLNAQSCSTWLIVILVVRRCCFGGLCVYETGLLLVCACRRTSAASVEPLPRGSRAVAFPRRFHVLSCSTWLTVRCCIGGLYYIVFQPNSNSSSKLKL
jgi:hypothetical protein